MKNISFCISDEEKASKKNVKKKNEPKTPERKRKVVGKGKASPRHPSKSTTPVLSAVRKVKVQKKSPFSWINESSQSEDSPVEPSSDTDGESDRFNPGVQRKRKTPRKIPKRSSGIETSPSRRRDMQMTNIRPKLKHSDEPVNKVDLDYNDNSFNQPSINVENLIDEFGQRNLQKLPTEASSDDSEGFPFFNMTKNHKALKLTSVIKESSEIECPDRSEKKIAKKSTSSSDDSDGFPFLHKEKQKHSRSKSENHDFVTKSKSDKQKQCKSDKSPDDESRHDHFSSDELDFLNESTFKEEYMESPHKNKRKRKLFDTTSSPYNNFRSRSNRPSGDQQSESSLQSCDLFL